MSLAVTAVVTSILIPLLLQEMVDWCPWLASRLIRLAAGTLPSGYRDRYRDEWLAELAELPGGKLTKLAFGVRVLVTAPRTRRALEATLLKGVFDLVVTSAALALYLPLLVVLWAAVRASIARSGALQAHPDRQGRQRVRAL